MKTKGLIISACMLILIGCAEVILPSSAPQLVIEGWIENGMNPVVMITTTVPVNSEVKDVEQLKDYIVTWGKVTISDGQDTVIMTGKADKRYFPPYIYTTSRMKGEVGKTYSIKVEYSGRTATATTTIPKPADLEYMKVIWVSDESYTIAAGLRDDPSEKNYYKSFVRIFGKDSTYTPSFMGLTDDAVLSEEIEELPVNNSLNNLFEKRGSSFSPKDTVTVRFCTLDEASYNYWSDFDDITSLSKNPFFPVTSCIRSNIKGGLGYWAGYGSAYYRVSIPDSLAAGRIYR